MGTWNEGHPLYRPGEFCRNQVYWRVAGGPCVVAQLWILRHRLSKEMAFVCGPLMQAKKGVDIACESASLPQAQVRVRGVQ
jgi:hypothetical protein